MSKDLKPLGHLCAVAALVASVFQIPTAGAPPAQTDQQCRRVQLTGTIAIVPKPTPGFRGVVITSEGKFKMDLIFPDKGGEVLYQQNTVELTRIASYSYGGAHLCKNTLHGDASAPRSFSIWARLVPDSVVFENASEKVTSIQDSFDLLLKTMPTFPAFTYTAQCEGGRPGEVSDYGTAHAQLLRVFNVTQYSGNIKLNRFGDRKSLPDVDIFGALKGRAEWEVLETLVPCQNFQYR